eukprot:3566175-Amphidinium_carterae.1
MPKLVAIVLFLLLSLSRSSSSLSLSLLLLLWLVLPRMKVFGLMPYGSLWRMLPQLAMQHSAAFCNFAAQTARKL